jgi:Spy/CpxP family protein refolding chaperone
MDPQISQKILSVEEQAKFNEILTPEQKAKIISDLSRYAKK